MSVLDDPDMLCIIMAALMPSIVRALVSKSMHDACLATYGVRSDLRILRDSAVWQWARSIELPLTPGWSWSNPMSMHIHTFAQLGILPGLEWARAHPATVGMDIDAHCRLSASGCDSKLLMYEAAASGVHEVVLWAHHQGCEATGAAWSCNLESVQWAASMGVKWTTLNSWNAATSGQLETLQWTRSQGYAWDWRVCEAAARHGWIELLKWSHYNGCDWDAHTCAALAHRNDMEALRWARAHGCDWDAQTCQAFAYQGNLEMLQWARGQGCPWDFMTCTSAASNGHLHIVQWARANGCDWDEFTCASAAAYGHLDVLEWARQHGCEWSSKTCSYAAEFGHIAVLEWARAHGCPWDSDTCAAAAYEQHLPVLEWLRARGCDWDARVCKNAALSDNLEMLQWARVHGCEWDSSVCETAAQYGHLAVLQWAHDHGCAWGSAMTRAAAFGRLHVLDWAYDAVSVSDWDSISEAAADTGQLAVLQWLCAIGCAWHPLRSLDTYPRAIQWGLKQATVMTVGMRISAHARGEPMKLLLPEYRHACTLDASCVQGVATNFASELAASSDAASSDAAIVQAITTILGACGGTDFSQIVLTVAPPHPVPCPIYPHGDTMWLFTGGRMCTCIQANGLHHQCCPSSQYERPRSSDCSSCRCHRCNVPCGRAFQMGNQASGLHSGCVGAVDNSW